MICCTKALRTARLLPFAMVAFASAWADTSPPATPPATSQAIPFKTQTPADALVSGPSVVVLLMLLAGLAWGLYVMRKRGVPLPFPKLTQRRMQVIESSYLSNRTRLHLVQLDQQHILVAESRGAVAISVLPASNADTPTQSS